jgi:hypothetical protein
MRSHVNIFDSIILGFAGGTRSEELWDDESPQREAACPPWANRYRIVMSALRPFIPQFQT